MSRYTSFALSLALGVVLAMSISPSLAEDAKSFAGKKPGDEWDGNSLKMKYCWCPAGKFVMGSPKDEEFRLDNEEQVIVTLSRGFWLSKYEVTQYEWHGMTGKKPSEFKGKTLPVEQVEWNEATKFCERLTKLDRAQGKLPDGWEYRLPTEAQWEYACRAGTSLPYSFGDDDPKMADDYAWHARNSGNRTHPVGQKKPNRWGLHDVHGNVNEWCRDWYQKELPGGTDPEATKMATRRVWRGGGWPYPYPFCRSAVRNGSEPGERNNRLGFRVAAVQVSK